MRKTKTMKQTSLVLSTLAAAAAIAVAAPAHAQETAEAEADFAVSTDDIGDGGGTSDDAAFLASGKFGGIFPLQGMSPFIAGGIELGWVFGGTEQRIAALLDVTYATPKGSGGEDDARLASGSYDWEITHKELVLQPTFMYRFTSDSKLTPYVGLGPRIYFVETVSRATAGDQTILDTQERSTKWGIGLPLGAEFELGPGGLFLEALLQWGPLDHRITGETSHLAANVYLGYRFLL